MKNQRLFHGAYYFSLSLCLCVSVANLKEALKVR
jgi:hypothetical protein